MSLNNLKPAKGSNKTAGKRLGRGQGSGKGGTSTKGHKGAQSRSGYSRKIGFEGGQMPLQRRIPKLGFKNINRVEYNTINVEDIQNLIDNKKIKKDFQLKLNQTEKYLHKASLTVFFSTSSIATAILLNKKIINIKRQAFY